VGQMAILNATFKYPSYPQFSDRIKKLIGGYRPSEPRTQLMCIQDGCCERTLNIAPTSTRWWPRSAL
jgi:hypothetical protein